MARSLLAPLQVGSGVRIDVGQVGGLAPPGPERTPLAFWGGLPGPRPERVRGRWSLGLALLPGPPCLWTASPPMLGLKGGAQLSPAQAPAQGVPSCGVAFMHH